MIFGASASFTLAAIGLPDDRLKAWLGAEATNALPYVVVVGFSLCLVIVAVVTLKATRAVFIQSDPVPAFRKARFACRVLDTSTDAALINHELVQRIFPDGSIETDHALRAQSKNPFRLLGLIDSETDQIAGWSSLWPVTVAAGQAIEQGRRTDDDLKFEDLLPATRNCSTKYLVLLSFGILPEYRNAAECPARRMGRFVIDHIINTFLCSTERSLRLVAVAYSREGERMCRLLGLEPNGCCARYPTGKSKPVFAGDVTIKSLIEISQKF